jgi:Domain of Unknown Function (DUF1206)
MFEPMARFGYASKAVIYAIVGGLALAAAANRGGRITDTSGALRVVLTQPFGRILLAVLAVGLCGYAAWRLADAAFDPERHGTGAGGLVERIGNAIRGTIYGLLGLEAFRLVRGLRGSNGREAEMWTSRIMELPLGDWIIGIVGAIVAVYGASEVRSAWRERVGRLIDLSPLPPGARTTVLNVSRFGVGARGVIIAALGLFLVRAAIRHDPSEAAGTRESMLELANVFEGRWMLWALAAGLLAYAVDQAVHARCRRIRSPI